MEPTDLEKNWAEQAAAFTRVIGNRDPTWGSRVFELAGGYAVLAGKGLFVNRGVGVGIGCEMRRRDFDRLEHESALVGVPSALEISRLTHPEVARTARSRGYRPASKRMVFVQNLGWAERSAANGFAIRAIGAPELAQWQDVAARAFGATGGTPRRASDAYASASLEIAEDRLLIARIDGVDAACASLTCREGIATLGGMGTVPEFRRRGAQMALIRARIALAMHEGCTWATSSAMADGSKRNLIRAGFEPLYEQVTWVRSSTQR